MDKAATWLKNSLDYQFSDSQLLQRALTHRSASGTNNERLEFLGDAVLDAVISEIVFRLEPEATEGDLSRLRSYLVKDVRLSELAAALGVGEHIVLGQGERRSGGHRRASILADALEAIFAAVYLDGGFEASRHVIERAYGQRLTSLPDAADLRDPKTRLQEYLQARRNSLPVYSVEQISGKAHAQTFTVTCEIVELGLTANGNGDSRRDAEQAAARALLKTIESRE